MKEKILYIISITIIILTGCTEKIKPIDKVSYQISRQSSRHTATGFFVTNNGYFVTSNHVVRGKSKIWIQTAQGRKISAQVVASEDKNDIALAKANIRSHPMPIGTQDRVEKGDEVLTLGFPLLMIQGDEQKASFGRINSFSGILGDRKMYQIDIPVQPGNSGGPLINDRGVVIGVIKATFNQVAALKALGTFTQGISYAIKSDRIIPMLKKELGNQLTLSNGTRSYRDFSDIINLYEKSVVVVIAE